MNLKDGLPCQADGDMQDTLNRAGLICIAWYFGSTQADYPYLNCLKFIYATMPNFVRYPGGNPKTTSGDQLAPIWCMKALGYDIDIRNIFFAPNTVDTTPGKWKLPIGDFIFFRIAPLLVRTMSNDIRIFRYLADIFLILLALSDWFYYRTDKDPADCNNTFVTFVTCNEIKSTIISRLVYKYWIKLCDPKTRLRRYHRKSSGGNEEIAERLCAII